MLQAFHDQAADFGGRDIVLAHGFELANDTGDHALDVFGLDLALAQGGVDGALQLVAVEGEALAPIS